MRVFVAGASGAIGSPLVRELAAGGHEVVAMTRAPAKVGLLRELGAQPVVAEGLEVRLKRHQPDPSQRRR